MASWFMNESDLLIVFGASFSDHTGITTAKPIVQVDFDRMALGKFHAVDAAVWGDIGRTAALLRERLPASGRWTDQRAELAERWRLWRDEKHARAAKDEGRGVNSAAVFEALSGAAPPDAVICVDVGNNTYSFGRYFECLGRQSVVMSGYLGSIGFAFPAAMGAWAAVGGPVRATGGGTVGGGEGTGRGSGDAIGGGGVGGTADGRAGRPVISVSGDGGFGQYMGELTTAVKYGMNITHVLLNNNELGKISKEQRDGEWKVWQTSLHNPSFTDYARICGAAGFPVDRAADLPEALAQALNEPGPSLVEVIADPLLT